MNNKAFLAHYIIYNGMGYRNSVYCRIRDKVQITPFSEETQNTIFINGIVIIGNENLINHKDKIIKFLPFNQESIKNIIDYLKNENLNVPENSIIETLVIEDIL